MLLFHVIKASEYFNIQYSTKWALDLLFLIDFLNVQYRILLIVNKLLNLILQNVKPICVECEIQKSISKWLLGIPENVDMITTKDI